MAISSFQGAACFAALLLSTCVSACTVYQLGSGGVADNMRELMALTSLLSMNGTFFLKPSSSPAYACTEGGGYLDYFQPATILQAWSQADEDSQPDAPCQKLNTEAGLLPAGQSSLDRAHDMGFEEMVANSAQKLWQLKPRVEKRVQSSLLQSAGETSAGFYVGPVGSDLASSYQEHARDLVDTFVTAFPDVKADVCLLVGESADALSAVSAEAESVLGCKVVKQDRTQAPAPGTLLNRCFQGLQAIEAVELLSHVDYFVGPLDQPVPHLVEVLRYSLYGKLRRTFADSSPGHSDWYQTIRSYLLKKKPLGRLAEDLPPSLDDSEPAKEPASSRKRHSSRRTLKR